MYGSVLLWALVAVTAPQAPARTEIGVAVPGFDVRAPEIWLSLEISSRPQDMETDTTFDVSPRARLELRNHAGEIVVSTWNRNSVRIQARHSGHDQVKIFATESSVKVKSESRHGPPDLVDYRITVPRTVALDLWGFYTDMKVDGVQNGVRAETLNGTVEISNCAGELSVRSVEGDVAVQRSRGRLEVNNVENEIRVTDFEGKLVVESIDGDIQLERIRSDEVEAKTVDGDISYQGTINDGGRYRLTTHNGDVIVAVPERVNATVSVATFDGEFEAEFPIQLSRAEATRRFSFVLGNGSARVELHSFDGDIRLVRR